jgi:Tfp pilus assembly protein PilF
MNRITCRRRVFATLAASLLLSNVGCLNSLPWGGIEAETPPAPTPGTKVELPPAKSAQLHLTLAEGMEKAGNYAEAAAFFEKARSLDAHVQVARQLAGLYDRLGDHPHAFEEYQKAFKATPKDANLYNNFGYRHYYSRGQWKDAEEQFRKAIALQSNHTRAWTNLGLTLAQQGRYDESLTAFEKAVNKAEAYSNLGFVLTTQGKKEEAKHAYRQALQLNPNLEIAHGALHRLEHPTPPAPTRTDSAASPAAENVTPASFTPRPLN